VIDAPPAPPGWEDARADLIRIVDPLGRGVAWLAPAHGGRCVGYAARPSAEKGTPWTQLLHTDGGGVRCSLLSDGLTPDNGWRFVERDPTAAHLETSLGALGLRFSATLSQGGLELSVSATNIGFEPLRLHLGLELALADAALRDAFIVATGTTTIVTEPFDDGLVMAALHDGVLALNAGETYRLGATLSPQ
jgi:hypothetical protein